MAFCKVLTYNVNTDMRAEMPNRETGKYDWEGFRWAHRAEGVFHTIMQSKADVVCLQELREESIADLLAERSITQKYFIDYGKTNGTDQAFYLATLVEKSMWAQSSKQLLWMTDTGNPSQGWDEIPGSNGFGRLVLVTHYAAPAIPDPKKKPTVHTIAESKSKQLTVINTHFGIPEGERMTEARNIATLCKDFAKEPCVVCGDFNSFPDKGGATQEEIILNTNFKAAAPYCAPLATLDGDHVKVVGTQISYPYDWWTDGNGKRHPATGEMGGHLDHIYFSPKLTIKEPAMLFSYGASQGYNPEAKYPEHPSDHLPLVATLYKQ